MRALTLWQPFATLVAIGAKKVEARTYGAGGYTGELAIHAARQTPPDARAIAFGDEAIQEALVRHFGGEAVGYSQLPTGAIIAIARIEKVERVKAPDAILSSFAWHLTEVEEVWPAVPARGSKDLWSVPYLVAEQVRENVRRREGLG